MNKLKVKATIACPICGVKMHRTKTLKVEAGTMEEAKKEAQQKYEEWLTQIKDTPCRICASILEEVAK